MKRLCLFVLFSLVGVIGCSPSDESSDLPPTEEGIFVQSPNTGDSLRVQWEWEVSTENCSWGFQAEDSSFTAVVRASVPGGVHEAKVLRRQRNGSNFQIYGNVIHPQGSQFVIDFARSQDDFPTPFKTDSIIFYVEVLAGNSTTWRSSAIEVFTVGGADVDTATTPLSPIMDTTIVFDSYVSVRWCDRSFNEDGFRIFYILGENDPATIEVPANLRETVITSLIPSEQLICWISAWNQYGISAPSDTQIVRIPGPPLPNPPSNINALALTSTIVRVTWIDHGDQDNFLIQRREPAMAWAQIGATPDNVQIFVDSFAVPLTRYFYRVGASATSGIAWSADSADITTPSPGAPLAPDNLSGEGIPGIGVHLHWVDHSNDEDWFQIERRLSGQPAHIIDSVFANVTSYFDDLGEILGMHSYRVRSGNEHGVSEWTPSTHVDYRFCSHGVLPICIGNYWEFDVDTLGEDYIMQRRIVAVEYPSEIDFYLLKQVRITGGAHDSLYFLRNFSDQGCMMIDYPLPSSPSPELWFRYPPGSTQDYYFVQGDCMKVVNAGPSTIIVGDTVFTGVISYQRFFTAQHSIQYFVRPFDVGIVQEIEFLSPTSPPTVRNLRRWQILN